MIKHNEWDVKTADSFFPLAFVFLKIALAQANEVGSHFYEFIVFDEIDCLFERENRWWGKNQIFISSRGAHIGEMFLFGDVDDESSLTGVLTDDHAFIDLVVPFHKEGASLSKENFKGIHLRYPRTIVLPAALAKS